MTFELRESASKVRRKFFPASDADLLTATSTSYLIQGEWMELNGSYQMMRGASDPGVKLAFAFYGQRGRTDQAVIAPNRGGSLLFAGSYECRIAGSTLLYDGDEFTVGDPVVVYDVADAAITGDRRGLRDENAAFVADGVHGTIIGYVTKISSTVTPDINIMQTLV